MKININDTKEVEVQTMFMHLKVCDRFCASFENNKNGSIVEYEGYVPSFMPEDHYGDYVELKIDLETGKILNWKKPTKEQLEKIINE